MIGIYKITNKITQECYIGQSINIQQRIKNHFDRAKNDSKKNREYDYPLHRAIRKYGKENFEIEILEECTVEELNDKEIYWITFFDSYRHGYNQTTGGQLAFNKYKFGEESGHHVLTEEDVKDIRARYASHQPVWEVYELYKDKISKSGFHKVWNGYNWPHIMMEVYTKENKDYHKMLRNSHPGRTTGSIKSRPQLTVEQIKDIRRRLLTETEDEIWPDYKEYFSYRHSFHLLCIYKTYPYITI